MNNKHQNKRVNKIELKQNKEFLFIIKITVSNLTIQYEIKSNKIIQKKVTKKKRATTQIHPKRKTREFLSFLFF